MTSTESDDMKNYIYTEKYGMIHIDEEPLTAEQKDKIEKIKEKLEHEDFSDFVPVDE